MNINDIVIIMITNNNNNNNSNSEWSPWKHGWSRLLNEAMLMGADTTGVNGTCWLGLLYWY